MTEIILPLIFKKIRPPQLLKPPQIYSILKKKTIFSEKKPIQ